jgi:hypothetical protein
MDSRAASWIICGAIVALLGLFAYWSSQPGPDSPSGPAVVGKQSSEAPVSGDTGISQLLSRTFTTSDPKQCTNDMTAAFLRQRYGSSKGTLDRCQRANVAADPKEESDSITVESVTVNGRHASAAFLANGGYFGGSVFTVRVVHQGDRWKLESLTDVRVERPTFDQHIKDSLRQEGYLPAEQTCAIAKFDHTVSDDDIARSIVVGDDSIGVAGYAASCLSRPTLLRVLGELFTANLRSNGLSGPVARCVVERMTRGVPTTRLRHLLAAGERGSNGWVQLAYGASRECLGGASGGSAGSSTT